MIFSKAQKSLKKFKSSTIKEKIFGTGWYSSRKTINNVRNKIIDENPKMLPRNVTKQEISHLQGIISLLLDTGLFGVIFTISIFSLTFNQILKEKRNINQKLFRISILMTNFLCLFIGYPMVMLSYVLMFLPNGILFIEDKFIKNTIN